MSAHLQFEFEAVRKDQLRVHGLVADLDRRIELIGKILTRGGVAKIPATAVAPAPSVPPPIPAPVPAPAPESVPAKAVEALPRMDVEFPASSVSKAAAAVIPAPLVERERPVDTPVESISAAPAGSWELAFGTVWLARIGIVILITGLVFLGNYAWQHIGSDLWRFIVTELGAGGKVTLLYLAGGMLAGVGAWLERRRESMRSYARVLLAGGAATIYYTTYAAHHVQRLRVIESPLVGGILLLGLAGGFILWAERRKSQTLAVLATLLAYYTSAINPVGTFTLFSALVLTAMAAFFMVRHRWTALGWISLLGTYGSFLFWRSHHALDAAAHSQVAGGASWSLGIAFLGCYWLLFTAALFLGKPATVSTMRPRIFATINNAAFFAIAAWQMIERRSEFFWLFAIAFGTVLLGLCVAIRERREDLAELHAGFLAQGLGLFTLGLVSKLTGYQLALVLALESALLLTAAARRHGWIFQLGAAVTAAGACGVAWYQGRGSWDGASIVVGGTIAAVMIGGGWWLKQRLNQLSVNRWSWRASWFVGLGVILTAGLILRGASVVTAPAWLAVAALAATFSFARLRLPELLLTHSYVIALTMVLASAALTELVLPFWTYSIVTAAMLTLEQWWQRQRSFEARNGSRTGFQVIMAVCAMIALYCWIEPLQQGRAWLLVTSGLALATLIYGIFTRAWATAAVGQIFNLLATQAFIVALWHRGVPAEVAITPVVLLAITSVVSDQLGKDPAKTSLLEWLPLSQISRAYLLLSVGAMVLWALVYVPGPYLSLFFAAVGAVALSAAALAKVHALGRIGLLLYAFAQAICWTRIGQLAGWLELLAIVESLHPCGSRGS